MDGNRLHSYYVQRPCDRCGYGHFNNVCPANNKVCFVCHKIGHFAKTCTQKAKSFKKTQRDKQRIQTFYQNVILRKEFPFANISNAALAQCMDLCSTLRTELKSVKCKLMKVKETYVREEQTLAKNVKDINTKKCILEQTVRDLQNQLCLREESNKVKEQNLSTEVKNLNKKNSKLIAENSKLKETVRDLQNKMNVSSVQKDAVSALKDKIQALEKERDMHKQCCEAFIKNSNKEFLEFEKRNQELKQMLATEMAQSEKFKLLHEKDQQLICDLNNEIDELMQCNMPYHPMQHVQQQRTIPFQQPNAPSQHVPLPYVNAQPKRGRRRSRRGTFL
ncbi:hypothetical protein FSP39_020711 [Pinctada imbricata]|uniref:CCHC-type domain-containing protein n=1 Tax=Pinctada imbricata TaxID=66713 RepID=A0AA88XTG3_PINIB|nr:hypothetical protein FSP39_020711 [Pinctada imbricata]